MSFSRDTSGIRFGSSTLNTPTNTSGVNNIGFTRSGNSVPNYDDTFVGANFSNVFGGNNTNASSTGSISVTNPSRTNNLETAQQTNASAQSSGQNTANNPSWLDNAALNQMNYLNTESRDARNQANATQLNANRLQANSYVAASANSANANIAASNNALRGVQATNQSNELINTQNTNTQRYGYDTQLNATRYSADSNYNTARYGADSNYAATALSSNNALAATRYSADANLSGLRYNADKGLEASKYNADASRFNTLLGVGAQYINNGSNYQRSFNR